MKINHFSKRVSDGVNICGFSNVDSFKFLQLSECQNKCNEMDNCLGFNFVDEQFCYLKQLLNEKCPINYHSNSAAYLKFELGKVFEI